MIDAEIVQNKQQTLKNEIEISGLGLFTGKDVTIRLIPAGENHGIVFQRTDLENKPKIPAHVKYVSEINRTTIIKKDNVQIQTVEHLLSALSAYGIDNLLIQISGPEILIGDGSSKIFVDNIDEVGVEKQNADKNFLKIDKPIFFSNEEIHIVAIPANEYRISYTLNYPNNDFLKSQYFTFLVNSKLYKKEIAPCRTYSLYEEIKPYLDNNLIKGGGLNNAVVIKDNKVLNPEGLRFFDEMVRHKILDLMGDMSLIGNPILAHIIAIKSGHLSNVAFARKIVENFKMEN